jgi:type II secretory ATPase GspE/PulE/Tfp pilus assembly ATPase PilB-like protein
MTDDLQQQIKPGCTLSDLTETARRSGYRTLLEHGIEKVREGLTTVSELERVLGQGS